MLLIVAAIGYFGANVGEAYFNYYRYQDRMASEARFAAHNTDAGSGPRFGVRGFARASGAGQQGDRAPRRARRRHLRELQRADRAARQDEGIPLQPYGDGDF